jgi:hypothetical protein
MNVREELKAYFDEELTLAEREQVETGLNASLRLELEQIGGISQTLKASATEIVPVGLEKTLKALEKPAPKVSWSRRPRWQWAAMGGLGVLALAVLFPNLTISGAKTSLNFESADRAKAAPSSSLPGPGAAGGFATSSPSEGSGKTFDGLAKSESLKGRVADGDSFVDASPPQIGGNPTFAPLIIRNGNLGVRVMDVRAAQQQSIDMARGLGGMVSDSNYDETDRTQPTAYVTLRIPEKLFENAMKQLANLGDVVQRNVTGSDVSASVVDIEARLRSMRNEEEQYRTVLKATKRIGDILIVKDRLSQVRNEIESLDAQRRNLRNQATYSTITATFMQKEKVGEPKKADGWAEESWASAINRLNGVGEFLGKAGINILVFAPVWIPLFLIAWVLKRKAN